ncbi:glycosyltransferase [Neobittarella massiliensis]|uniref:Glycosyltransferase n=1 Tax=Neobittarella massiliensis (ex Bilen et al. 2018) TaxID=2041842 RepID=A0A8J6IMQ9_9FIRM|nr:glycosyltransferase [Neobittarella massiliensis]MBC3516414.1 glycosyltransferase [Neobittarella massiliensis]
MTPIYITCLHLNYGGVERMIVSLANAFANLGYSVHILCTYRLGKPAYNLDSSVKVVYLTDCVPNREAFQEAVRRKKVLSIFKQGIHAIRTLYQKRRTLIKVFKKITEGTIISTRHEHSVLLSRFGNRGVLKIAQLHHDHGFQNKLVKDFQTKYKSIDYLVLLTEQTCKELQQILQEHNTHTKCVTIPNFIFPPEVEIPAQKKKQVIAAGRLHPDKNFSCLLRIWETVIHANGGTGWRLVIAGEGLLEQDLKNEAEHLGIAQSVDFTGPLPYDQLMQRMAESYCYVLTSKQESFGLVLAESMSCGTPPIAFDVRVGPRAIISDGVDGYLIPPQQEKLFAEKLLFLLNHPQICASLGQAAIQNVERFYPESILRLWAKILPNA